MTNVEPVPHPYGSSAAMRNDKKIQVYGNRYFKGGKSMKKQLSIVLSMAMAASVLTVVPAMAEGGDVVNRVERGAPGDPGQP